MTTNKQQPTKAAKHLVDQLCGDTGHVVEGHGKAFLDKSRNQTYQAADDAGLRVAVEKLKWIVEGSDIRLDDLHLAYISKAQKALAALQGEQESEDE